MSQPQPHDYDCRCRRCRAMAAAIGAQTADGRYFYSDEELFQLALQQEQEEAAEERSDPHLLS